MPRPKSLLPNAVVDQAKKAHPCQHNPRHRLERGQKRLKVRVGRTYEHFCAECSIDTIERDIAKLQALKDELLGD